MCLSLLIHGGALSAYLAFRQQPKSSRLELHHEPALAIEIVSEPAPDTQIIRAPMPAKAPEVPSTLPTPTPPSPVPEIKQTSLAVANISPVEKSEAVESAPPATEPAVTFEAKTVFQTGKAEPTSQPAPAMAEGVPANYFINPKPLYPVESRQRREEGVVVLAIQVNQEGVPGRIQIVQSSHFRLLDEAAIKAVSQWRFTPAKLGNLAVTSQIEVPIRFKLSESK